MRADCSQLLLAGAARARGLRPAGEWLARAAAMLGSVPVRAPHSRGLESADTPRAHPLAGPRGREQASAVRADAPAEGSQGPVPPARQPARRPSREPDQLPAGLRSPIAALLQAAGSLPARTRARQGQPALVRATYPVPHEAAWTPRVHRLRPAPVGLQP